MRGALKTALVRLAGLASLAVLALGVGSLATCRRRPPGTCGEDLDCAPGFDCRAGACVRRERLRSPVAPPPADDADASAPGDEAPSVPAASSSATTVDSPHDAAGPVPPARPASPPTRTPDQPPPASAPPPPAGREPIWKQRLKNS